MSRRILSRTNGVMKYMLFRDEFFQTLCYRKQSFTGQRTPNIWWALPSSSSMQRHTSCL